MESLEQLRNVTSLAARCIDVQLNFIDEKCQDISAYMVLSLLMKKLPRVFMRGMINPEIAKVLQSFGIARSLGIGRIQLHVPPRSLILPFRMVTRVQPRKFGDSEHQLKPQASERVADRFCSAMEAWLALHKIQLSAAAQGSIVETITEALDNAERHGWPDEDGLGDWSMAGFCRLNVSDAAEISVDCCFAIVNVGETISESLDSASVDVRRRIDSYLKDHASSNKGRVESLRTVMALQDGITRIAEANDSHRGGIGLMELTTIVAELGGLGEGDIDSRLSIVSGSSHLRIMHPYRSGEAPTGSRMRELWFNDANCASQPPDPNHVMTMTEHFPGTIIAARFSIDPAYLVRKISENEFGADGRN